MALCRKQQHHLVGLIDSAKRVAPDMQERRPKSGTGPRHLVLTIVENIFSRTEPDYLSVGTAVHRHYAANQMTLVVLGKESLSELQQAVEEKFSAVPKRGCGLRPSSAWIGKVKPFLDDRAKPLQAFNVVPVKVGRCIAVIVVVIVVVVLLVDVSVFLASVLVSQLGGGFRLLLVVYAPFRACICS